MARDGLQTVLRATVRKAIEEGREVGAQARVRRSSAVHPVQIVVAPLRRGRDAESRLLVSFLEREVEPEALAPKVEEATAEGELQAELEATRKDLRLTVEQMEAANGLHRDHRTQAVGGRGPEGA